MPVLPQTYKFFYGSSMVESIATWDIDVFCPGPTNGVETSVCSTTSQIIEKLQWHLQVNKLCGNLIAFSMHHLDGQIRESDRKLIAGITGGRKVYFSSSHIRSTCSSLGTIWMLCTSRRTFVTALWGLCLRWIRNQRMV